MRVSGIEPELAAPNACKPICHSKYNKSLHCISKNSDKSIFRRATVTLHSQFSRKENFCYIGQTNCSQSNNKKCT